MNRKEALWRVRPKTEQDDLKDVTHDTLVKIHNATVDEIFNDFESRTCDNCKYCEEDSNDTDVWIECRNPLSEMEHTSLLSDAGYPNIVDFGCNKWEQK